MREEYCEDCGLIYSIGRTVMHCNSFDGTQTKGHDVVDPGWYYVWDRSMYFGSGGGGFASTIRHGQGGGLHQKSKLLFIDLDDFVNNPSEVKDEIYSYLTKNGITERIAVKGTLEQHANARLTTGGKYRFDKATNKIVHYPSSHRSLRIHMNLRVLKKIGLKISLLIYDNSAQTVTRRISN